MSPQDTTPPDTSPVACALCGTASKPSEEFGLYCDSPCAMSRLVYLDVDEWNTLQSAIHAHAERRVEEVVASRKRPDGSLFPDPGPVVMGWLKEADTETVFEAMVEQTAEYATCHASAVSEAVEPYKTLSADLQGTIGDLRREVEAQQRATSIASESASEVSGALSLIESAVTLSPRDWSLDARDAIIYGVAVGWGDALRDIIRRHSWDYRASDAVYNGHAALAPYRSRGEEGENVAMPCTYCGQPATRFHIPDPGVGTCEDCLKSGLAPSGAAKEGEA